MFLIIETLNIKILKSLYLIKDIKTILKINRTEFELICNSHFANKIYDFGSSGTNHFDNKNK